MQHRVMSSIAKRVGLGSALLLTVIALAPAEAPAGADLRLGIGYVGATGEVSDMLIGPGVDFSVSALAGVSDQLYLGAGLRGSGFSGKDEMGVDITTGGARFGLELQVLYYFVPSEASVRPYAAASLGYGAMVWDYSDAARPFFGSDDDGIGYVYLAPCVGVDFSMNEKAGLYAEARFSFAGYEDETTENLQWDLDGGHFLEISGGFRVRF